MLTISRKSGNYHYINNRGHCNIIYNVFLTQYKNIEVSDPGTKDMTKVCNMICSYYIILKINVNCTPLRNNNPQEWIKGNQGSEVNYNQKYSKK